jgi:predicted nucleic acid-binding protein
MIVVDSSVWIDFLHGRNAPHVRRLRMILGADEIVVGDLILCDVLQGQRKGELKCRYTKTSLFKK